MGNQNNYSDENNFSNFGDTSINNDQIHYSGDIEYTDHGDISDYDGDVNYEAEMGEIFINYYDYKNDDNDNGNSTGYISYDHEIYYNVNNEDEIKLIFQIKKNDLIYVIIYPISGYVCEGFEYRYKTSSKRFYVNGNKYLFEFNDDIIISNVDMVSSNEQEYCKLSVPSLSTLYSITINGEPIENINLNKIVKDTSISVKIIPKTGYECKGFIYKYENAGESVNVQGDTVSIIMSDNVTISNVNISKIYIPKYYDIIIPSTATNYNIVVDSIYGNNITHIKENTSVTITINPDDGYEFISFKYKLGNSSWIQVNNNTLTLDITNNITISYVKIAQIKPINYYALSIPSSHSNYTISHNLGTNTNLNQIEEGTSVTITITPKSGYVFKGFAYKFEHSSTPIQVNTNSITINLTDNVTITSVNVISLYKLILPSAPSNYTISHNLGTNTNLNQIEEGTSVIITINPNTGYTCNGFAYKFEHSSTAVQVNANVAKFVISDNVMITNVNIAEVSTTNYYSITYADTPIHYSISHNLGSNADLNNIAEGTRVTITINPANGYECKGFKYKFANSGSAIQVNSNSVSFTLSDNVIISNVNVEVISSSSYCTITVPSNIINGSIQINHTGTDLLTVPKNSQVIIYPIPNNNCEFSSLKVTGITGITNITTGTLNTSTNGNKGYKFTITNNVSISNVIFSEIDNTIDIYDTHTMPESIRGKQLPIPNSWFVNTDEPNDTLTVCGAGCNVMVMEHFPTNNNSQNPSNINEKDKWDIFTIYNDINDETHWTFPSFTILANAGRGPKDMCGYCIIITNIVNGSYAYHPHTNKVTENDYVALEIPSYSTTWDESVALINHSDWNHNQVWEENGIQYSYALRTELGARHFLESYINGRTRWDRIVDYYYNMLGNVTDEIKDEKKNYTLPPLSNYSNPNQCPQWQNLNSQLRNICNFNESGPFETVYYSNNPTKVKEQHSMRIFYNYSRPNYGMNTPDHAELKGSHSDLEVKPFSGNAPASQGHISMSVQRIHGAKKSDWQNLIDEYFKIGGVLDLLNQNIDKWKSQIGDPPFGRHTVILTIPTPCGPSHMINPNDLEWGELNGKIINFATQDYIDAGYPICWSSDYVNSFYKMHANCEAKMEALKWYVDEITNEINSHNYENFDITGLYFIDENLKWNDVWEEIPYTTANWKMVKSKTEFRFPIYDSQQKKYTKIRYTTDYIINPLSDYVRQKGFKLHWYPYSTSYSWKNYDNMNDTKWSNWEKLKEGLYCRAYGVDVPIIQTGFPFSRHKDRTISQLRDCIDSIKRMKSGIMLEVGSDALSKQSSFEYFLTRYEQLLNLYYDDPEFYQNPENGIVGKPYTNIGTSALQNWWFDAYLHMRFMNMVTVYKYNMKEFSNATTAYSEAKRIEKELYAWNYRWEVTKQAHKLSPTKVKITQVNTNKNPYYKMELYYGNSSDYGIITDNHMQRLVNIMEKISSIMQTRNNTINVTTH